MTSTQTTLSRLSITAMGMATSLGVDADTACAAARAGISRARDIETYLMANKNGTDMVPLKGHPVSWLTEGFSGLGRLARLGSLALQDLWPRTGLEEDALRQAGVFLALPSGYYHSMAEHFDDEPAPAEFRDEQTLALRAELDAKLVPAMFALGGMPAPERSVCCYADAAGLGMALAGAFEALAEGGLRYAIVGGIDSQLEPHTLDALARHGLLKAPGNGFGFLPGEGAALWLLERPDDVREVAPALARIHAPAVAQADGHHIGGAPPNGIVLATVILQAAARLPSGGKQVGTLIGSHNGNPWFASEWGRARVRISRALPRLKLWRAVDSFGETAAAMGAIGVCLAAKEVDRRGAGHEAVMWLSSPAGDKAAVGVS